MLHRFATAFLAALAAAVSPARAAEAPAVSQAIEALAGARCRLAWVRDGDTLVLLDTGSPAGEVERRFSGVAEINRPVITPSGRQVVFIDFSLNASYIADWDGADARKLVEGRATHVRADAAGREWVYWQTMTNEMRVGTLEEPGAGEVVWRLPGPVREGKTENFQTSADGRRAGSNHPWPHVGMAVLPRAPGQDFVRVGSGCWPQIARDNSYRILFCCDGRHDRLALVDASGARCRFVAINPSSDWRQRGAECHRWANDPRLLVCGARAGESPVREVFMGRFSEDFSRLGDWIVVSSRGANTEPDLWVSSAAGYPAAPPPADALAGPGPSAAEEQWPVSHDGLQVLWENLGSRNRILAADGGVRRQCVASLEGLAVPARWRAVDLRGGRLLPASGAEEFVAAAASNNAFTVEVSVMPPRPTGQVDRTRGAIVTCGGAGGARNFTLWQDGGRLNMAVRTAQPDGTVSSNAWTVGRIDGGRYHHVCVTWNGAEAVAYVDGAETARRQVRGSLSCWTSGPLVCGDAPSGGENWPGVFEGFALYSRALTPREASDEAGIYLSRLASRAWPTAIAVTGRLVSATRLPELKSLEYPRCLLAYVYAIVSDRYGKRCALSGQKVVVLHWGMLDRKPLRIDRQAGQSYPLQIESVNDRPEIRSERIVDDTGLLDAPVYLDAAR